MKKLIFLLIICSFSCEKKVEYPTDGAGKIHDGKDDRVYFSKNKEFYPLVQKAINEGDTVSYDAAAKMVILEGGEVEFFRYSFTMAHKYNYGRAYHDLYWALKPREGRTLNGVEVNSSDKNTEHMANYFLLKSYELKYKDAKYDIKSVFGKTIPTSEEYLCEDAK